MGDRHIRCAAADVDGRDAQRRPGAACSTHPVRTGKGGEGHRSGRQSGRWLRYAARPADRSWPSTPSKFGTSTTLFPAVCVDKILVPRLPAHRFPNNSVASNMRRRKSAPAFGMAERQRQDQRAQLARRRRKPRRRRVATLLICPSACASSSRAVGHQGAAAVCEVTSARLRQREERLAVIVHQVHQRERWQQFTRRSC